MQKVLSLNDGKKFAHSVGRYSATRHQAALGFLDRMRVTQIDAGYDLAAALRRQRRLTV